MHQALAELERIAPTASLYPHLARQVERLAAHCRHGMGQGDGADLTASRSPATVWEAIFAVPDPLINTILSSRPDIRMPSAQPETTVPAVPQRENDTPATPAAPARARPQQTASVRPRRPVSPAMRWHTSTVIWATVW